MMFDERDRHLILTWAKAHPAPRPLRLVTTDDPRSDDLGRFVHGLAGLLPSLEIRRETEAGGGAPMLAAGKRIRYHAVPTGPELTPFLTAMSRNGHRSEPLPAKRLAILAAVDTPAPLRLFVSPGCPYCPAAARSLIAMATACDRIALTVIDGFLFHEMAEADDIRSVPTLLLDPGFRWTGTLDIEEIAQAMADRDPAAPGAHTLRGLIEAGEAHRVARMMRDQGIVFPALFDLLTHAKWPVRLGAMVTMEHLAAEHPELAARGAHPLWRRFADADDQIRGDLLYVLGEIAPPAMADAIEAATRTSPQAEVREAAMEAIEKIRQRDDCGDRP